MGDRVVSFIRSSGKKLLAGISYDPATRVQTAILLQAITAIDTTNLRVTFTAPASGVVSFVFGCALRVNSSIANGLMLGILDGSTIRWRAAAPVQSPTPGASTIRKTGVDVEGLIAGLTPGNTYTFDLAWGVEIDSSVPNIDFGGPNDTTTDNAGGAIEFEIYEEAA